MNRNKGVPRWSVLILTLALTILACQGVSGLNPFVTATPTATLTFTPTVTPSPTLTFTPTSTFTPTFTPTVAPPPSGRLTQEQPDGTTLFTDLDGGYQVTFPKGWTVVILEKDQINDALDRVADQQENMSKLIDSIRGSDVNKLIRVVGFNFDAQQGAYTPNINISYDTNPVLSSITLENLIKATVDYFPSLGIQVVGTEIKETSSGVQVGMIQARWALKVPNGQKVNLEQKQVFFKSGEGVAGITFTTIKNATVDLNPDLEQLIESIRLLD